MNETTRPDQRVPFAFPVKESKGVFIGERLKRSEGI